jgi:hypothetical protein
VGYDGQRVRYWYKDHVTGKREEEQVAVLTFIGRMVQHIFSKGFQRIRYYGLHAVCRAAKLRAKIAGLLKTGLLSTTGTYLVTGYRQRIKKSFGRDPLLCSRCGATMELAGIWHPKYGWIIGNRGSFSNDNIAGQKDEEEYFAGRGVALWSDLYSTVSV